MKKPKQQIITFKVDDSLAEAMQGIANRSDFIRSAILAALEDTCPLCHGTGFLSPEQKRHWEEFTEHHELRECADCHELHLVCSREDDEG